MANKFQKLLFNLSTISPMALIFAVVYWIEFDVSIYSDDMNKFCFDATSVFLLVIMVVSTVYSFYCLLFVDLCKKHLERIPVAIDSITPDDKGVTIVLLSYALPAAGIIFRELHIFISIVIILAWLLFLALSNSIIPNPLLMLKGYHFYKITTIDGSNDIYLLSKRKSIQNRNTVNTVMVTFNYLAIEEETGDV